MKKLLIMFVIIFSVITGAQTLRTLTLQECYELAVKNYPLTKQRILLQKKKEDDAENVSKGYFPGISVIGQATHQSDVTQIPINFPGINIPTLSKDQYLLYGEIDQPLTDLLKVTQEKNLYVVNDSIQQQNLEVDLYKIKDRINKLFFGTLLINEQIKLNELLENNIKLGIETVKAEVNNGAELESTLDKLKAELLKDEQKGIELKTSEKEYFDVLGMYINQNLDEMTILVKPQKINISNVINRPELSVFNLQQKSYEIQRKLVTINNFPKFELFFQGGIGKPSPVNSLTGNMSSYYIGGIRLNWAINNFYTYGNDKQLNEIESERLNTQKETFLFNTDIALKQQIEEIKKYQELYNADDEIVKLRESIRKTANVQLKNGTITANDFLQELNAEDQSRQSRLLHEIQLLTAQYDYQNISGNYKLSSRQ